jgi:serine/threonine protein phosphatase PrpC
MLTASGTTHPGRIRKNNEDCWLSDPELGLFVVADGMGGHNAGQVASELAVDAIKHFLVYTQDGEHFTWPFGVDPNLSFDANRLMTSIKLANRRVFKTGETHEDYTGMGTTVVAAFIGNGLLTFSGVGDSRLYSFVDGTLLQLTKDDSWIASLGNDVDRASVSHHPLRNVLTNALGAREHLDMETHQRSIRPGELLLLCSDGLHGALPDDDIGRILKEEPSAESASNRLVQAALALNGSDNITALVVRYDA